MPKRLRDDEVDAALEAGDPPRSEGFANDASWHREQSKWLKRWRPDASLPQPGDTTRRTEWDKLTKAHARAVAAGEKREEKATATAAQAQVAAAAGSTLTGTAIAPLDSHTAPAPALAAASPLVALRGPPYDDSQRPPLPPPPPPSQPMRDLRLRQAASVLHTPLPAPVLAPDPAPTTLAPTHAPAAPAPSPPAPARRFVRCTFCYTSGDATELGPHERCRFCSEDVCGRCSDGEPLVTTDYVRICPSCRWIRMHRTCGIPCGRQYPPYAQPFVGDRGRWHPVDAHSRPPPNLPAGYAWPPPEGSWYRFLEPTAEGYCRVSIECVVPPSSGATDDTDGDADYLSHLGSMLV